MGGVTQKLEPSMTTASSIENAGGAVAQTGALTVLLCLLGAAGLAGGPASRVLTSLAGLGVLGALVLRSRFGLTISLLGIAFGLAVRLDPQGSLYNVRLLPLWFISVYLMAAWALGRFFIAVAEWWRLTRARRYEAWPAG